MAETSLPFENTDVSESQFAKWARAIVGNGIVEGLTVTAGSGMQTLVATGTAMVRGVFYENDASKPLTISSAPATGNTRLDLVVLRLDFTANTLLAVVKNGTANTSGGTLPALTQTDTVWEHPIEKITVAAGTAAITGGMLQALDSDVGQRVVTYADDASRVAPLNAPAIGLNRSTKVLSLWDGATWVDLNTSVAWAGITGKPDTFPPSTPIDANTLNGMRVDHGTVLPSSGNDGDVFLLHS